MSAKLRSACTPPAVAHAPMVTSSLDCSRISRMRCSSWWVVIDPSTSDTSYGPPTIALDASAKVAICTWSARVSSSSSQSSRVSWQPSQEANFHTANVVGLTLNLLPLQQRAGNVVTDDGAVAAQQQRTQLAMTAPADSALHVAFQ